MAIPRCTLIRRRSVNLFGLPTPSPEACTYRFFTFDQHFFDYHHKSHTGRETLRCAANCKHHPGRIMPFTKSLDDSVDLRSRHIASVRPTQKSYPVSRRSENPIQRGKFLERATEKPDSSNGHATIIRKWKELVQVSRHEGDR